MIIVEGAISGINTKSEYRSKQVKLPTISRMVSVILYAC